MGDQRIKVINAKGAHDTFVLLVLLISALDSLRLKYPISFNRIRVHRISVSYTKCGTSGQSGAVRSLLCDEKIKKPFFKCPS